MSIYLLATLDTKLAEAAFVRDRLAALGHEVALVDCSCLSQEDRGAAVGAMAARAARIVAEAHAAGKVQGVLGLGGSAGTTIGTVFKTFDT